MNHPTELFTVFVIQIELNRFVCLLLTTGYLFFFSFLFLYSFLSGICGKTFIHLMRGF